MSQEKEDTTKGQSARRGNETSEVWNRLPSSITLEERVSSRRPTGSESTEYQSKCKQVS